MRLVIFVLSLLVASSSVCSASPSFDCAKAQSVAEHAICASDDLAFLDKDLATAYDAALKSGVTSVEEQRAWLQLRDRECRAVRAEECVRDFLWKRLDQLIANSPPTSEEIITIDGQKLFVRLLSGSEAQEPLSNLKRAMEKAGELECSRMVDVPSGTENHAYGADCMVIRKNGARDHAMVCNALMTNAFHYQYLGERKISSKYLGFFAGSNCAGG